MSERISIINQVILDNYMKDENLKEEAIEKVTEEENENKSFDQLQSLQLLIQKQSSIKELCKFFYIKIFFIFQSYKRKG